MITLGRNDPCHCGSDKKYKKCHLPKDEEKERKRLEKAAFKPLTPEEAEKKTGGAKPAEKRPAKNWLGNVMGKMGFARSSLQRRTGPSGSGGG
ncbi:MAG: SEC-C metal-binding domain-containing protein [Elusimicrobiota bacterium]|jgi:hypothetical protein